MRSKRRQAPSSHSCLRPWKRCAHNGFVQFEGAGRRVVADQGRERDRHCDRRNDWAFHVRPPLRSLSILGGPGTLYTPIRVLVRRPPVFASVSRPPRHKSSPVILLSCAAAREFRPSGLARWGPRRGTCQIARVIEQRGLITMGNGDPVLMDAAQCRALILIAPPGPRIYETLIAEEAHRPRRFAAVVERQHTKRSRLPTCRLALFWCFLLFEHCILPRLLLCISPAAVPVGGLLTSFGSLGLLLFSSARYSACFSFSTAFSEAT